MNYLMIVIDGWVLNSEFLSDYFYREFKKAEKEDIGWKEFLSNLEKVNKALRDQIDKPYYEQLHLWYRYDAQQRERDETVKMGKPEKTDCGIPLIFMTNQKYTGHLWGSHLDYIEKSINEGCEKLLREKGLFPLFYYEIPLNITPSEAANSDPAKLQRLIILTQKMNDLSFENELERKKPEQVKEYLDFHLRCYLRNDGKQNDWIKHTKKLIPINFSPFQRDAFLSWIEDNQLHNENGTGENDYSKKYLFLKDIFINEAAYTECINALKEVTNPKPIISPDSKYLLGPRMKGAFAAWVDLIDKRGKIKSVSNSIMAELLNKEIEGLNLYKDGGILSDTTTTYCKKYYTPLSKLIK